MRINHKKIHQKLETHPDRIPLTLLALILGLLLIRFLVEDSLIDNVAVLSSIFLYLLVGAHACYLRSLRKRFR